MSFLTFNFGWWACALAAANGYWWLGPALMPLWVALNLAFSPVPLGEGVFLAFLGVFGFAFDSLLLQTGLFQTGSGSSLAPLWLVSMWILLGFTYESLRSMRRRLPLLLFMGGVSGPLSYFWGEGLHIVRYARPLWLALGVHAVIWAGLTLFLFSVREGCLKLGSRRGAPSPF